MFLSRKVFAVSFCGFYFYKMLLSFIIFYYCKGIIKLLALSECKSWYLLAAIFEEKKNNSNSNWKIVVKGSAVDLVSGIFKVPHPQNSEIRFGVSTAKINSAKIDFFGISICKNKFLKNFFCKNSFFKVSIPYVIVLPFPLPQLLPSLSLFQIYLPGEGIIERLEKRASSSFSIIHKSKIEKSIDKG